MSDELERTQTARAAAELALVRIVHHYGAKPEFVVLGGLVPELLCSLAGRMHAGTTDIDVQVDLEIAGGAVNTGRLEHALRNANFVSTAERAWRWESVTDGPPAVVKFELLSDLPDHPEGITVRFDDCDNLGAANLRGTRFASQDIETRTLGANVGGVRHEVEVNVTGMAGFLMAKVAAAHGRRKAKDWYDIAFVLLHNDAGGVQSAIDDVLQVFGGQLAAVHTPLLDLRANFAVAAAQGPQAYADQITLDHPDEDPAVTATDAQLAVTHFCNALLARAAS